MKIDSGYWRDWEVWLEDDKGKRLRTYSRLWGTD